MQLSGNFGGVWSDYRHGPCDTRKDGAEELQQCGKLMSPVRLSSADQLSPTGFAPPADQSADQKAWYAMVQTRVRGMHQSARYAMVAAAS